MADSVTKPTDLKVSDYLNTVGDEVRRRDCEQLVDLMRTVTGETPVMWGPSIIGFGKYHYRYASGREGDTLKIGFSSRKEGIAIYGVIFYENNTELLTELGKHKQGKGCLYVKKLSDINIDVLTEMFRNGYRGVRPDEVE